MGITFISVLYYSSHLLENLVENLSENVNATKEIICVNNSPEEIEFTHSLLKVLTQDKNLGYGAAINFGLKHAAYDNIVIINPDALLETFVFSFKKDQYFIASGYNLDFPYASKFPLFINDLFRITLRRIAIIKMFDFLMDNPLRKLDIKKRQDVDYVSGALIITNKSTLELLKGFDERFFLFYEEVDLCRRALKNNIVPFISENVIFSHGMQNAKKASSINVKDIKVQNEIKSFLLYNKIYRTKGKFLFVYYFLYFFTMLSIVIFTLLSIIPIRPILNRKKLFKNYFYGIKSVNYGS